MLNDLVNKNTLIKYRLSLKIRKVCEKIINQAIILGRITSEVNLQKNAEGKTFAVLELAVQRSFKNSDGEYEVDIIPITLWNNIADSVTMLKTNDLIGVKGRIKSTDGKLEIIAEKITFLSSSARSEAK